MNKKSIFIISVALTLLVTTFKLTNFKEGNHNSFTLSSLMNKSFADGESMIPWLNESSPGDDSSNQYCPGSYPEYVTVECVRTSSGDNGVSSDWNVSGGVAANWHVVDANVSGGYNSSNSNNQQTVVTGRWIATGINCIPRYSPDACTSHYPC